MSRPTDLEMAMERCPLLERAGETMVTDVVRGDDESGTSRQLKAEGKAWVVHEVDATSIPGARGTKCLLFESTDVIRRIWRYPLHWRSLDDQALWRVCADVSVDARRAMEAAVSVTATAQDLTQSAADLVTTNRELRGARDRLLVACRASRAALQDAVGALTRDLRSAGVQAGPALVLVKETVRDGLRDCATSQAETDAAVQEAGQWCIRAYFVA